MEIQCRRIEMETAMRRKKNEAMVMIAMRYEYERLALYARCEKETGHNWQTVNTGPDIMFGSIRDEMRCEYCGAWKPKTPKPQP